MKRFSDDKLSASTGRAKNGFDASLPTQVQPPMVDTAWQQQQYAQQAYFAEQRRQQEAYYAQQRAEASAASERSRAEAIASAQRHEESTSSSQNSGGGNSGGGGYSGGSGGGDGSNWQDREQQKSRWNMATESTAGRINTGRGYVPVEVIYKAGTEGWMLIRDNKKTGKITGHLDGNIHRHGIFWNSATKDGIVETGQEPSKGFFYGLFKK